MQHFCSFSGLWHYNDEHKPKPHKILNWKLFFKETTFFNYLWLHGIAQTLTMHVHSPLWIHVHKSYMWASLKCESTNLIGASHSWRECHLPLKAQSYKTLENSLIRGVEYRTWDATKPFVTTRLHALSLYEILSGWEQKLYLHGKPFFNYVLRINLWSFRSFKYWYCNKVVLVPCYCYYFFLYRKELLLHYSLAPSIVSRPANHVHSQNYKGWPLFYYYFW